MQDLFTGFPQTQPLYIKISKTEFHRSKVHSSMICKVLDNTSFFCSYDHQESSRSYLARHQRSGRNSMISQALHNKKTELKIHVLPPCEDLHSFIYSSPDRTLTLFSTGSPLTTTKKLVSLSLSPQLFPNSSPSILLIFLFPPLFDLLPNPLLLLLSVLAYPPVFPFQLPPQASFVFRFPRRHILLHHSSMQRCIHSINPAVISLLFHPKTARQLLPHASHAQ